MKLVLVGLLFSAFIVSTLAMPSFVLNHKAEKADTFKDALLQYLIGTMMNEEAEEAQFIQIDRCYQYKDCTGAYFSKQAIAAKSPCCNKFGGQSYILTDGSVCRNC